MYSLSLAGPHPSGCAGLYYELPCWLAYQCTVVIILACFGNRLRTTNAWIKVCIPTEPCWFASHWLCWDILRIALLACIPVCRAGYSCLLQGLPCWLAYQCAVLVILACCRACFGNRLHPTNAQIKVCIDSEPCWLASQYAVLGYTTNCHYCWLAYQCAVLVISCYVCGGTTDRVHSSVFVSQ